MANLLTAISPEAYDLLSEGKRIIVEDSLTQVGREDQNPAAIKLETYWTTETVNNQKTRQKIWDRLEREDPSNWDPLGPCQREDAQREACVEIVEGEEISLDDLAAETSRVTNFSNSRLV